MMLKAESMFFLAVFSLLGTGAHGAFGSSPPTASKNAPPNVCAFEPGAIVSDACASYSSLDSLNDRLHPYISELSPSNDFFSYYRLNLYNKKCPFWSEENGMCGNIACAVNTLDNEEDIPLVWRAEELGKLAGPKAAHPGKKLQSERGTDRPLQGELGKDVDESCVVEYDDECDERDYCVPEDESAGAKGDYVSLLDNPERFTGYAGAGAQQVWQAIYRENCFSTPQDLFSDTPADESTVETPSPFGLGSGNPLQQRHAAQDLRRVMKQHGMQQSVQQAIASGLPSKTLDDGLGFDEVCVEKRVFYRVVSGMHASISTHICSEYLNRTSGEWVPNLQCYVDRLHNHPERISNLYFDYALLLRAVGKLRNQIQYYQFCSADPGQDATTKAACMKLAQAIPPGPEIFDESVLFNGQAGDLKEDFRQRFRNISRIMDCVGCDKCRLWGKLQIAGYGTALKVLFEFDEQDSKNNPPLRRHELVALINTLARVSDSLNAIKDFRLILEGGDGPAESVFGSQRNKDAQTLRTRNHNRSDEGHNDDPEDAEGPPRRRIRGEYEEDASIEEVFWEELEMVWQTFIYVMRSWVRMPGKAWHIMISELSRLWQFFIGLPIAPRSWEIKYPTRDDL